MENATNVSVAKLFNILQTASDVHVLDCLLFYCVWLYTKSVCYTQNAFEENYPLPRLYFCIVAIYPGWICANNSFFLGYFRSETMYCKTV